jgi:hypothetical protein
MPQSAACKFEPFRSHPEDVSISSQVPAQGRVSPPVTSTTSRETMAVLLKPVALLSALLIIRSAATAALELIGTHLQ